MKIMKQREEQKRMEEEAVDDKAVSDSDTGSNVGFGGQQKKAKPSFFGQQN